MLSSGAVAKATVGLLDLTTHAVVHKIELPYSVYPRGFLDDGRLAVDTFRNLVDGAALLSFTTGAIAFIGDKATSVTTLDGHTIAVGNGPGICDVYLQDMRNGHRTPLQDCPQLDLMSASGRRVLGWQGGPAIIDAATGTADLTMANALIAAGLMADEESWLDETHVRLHALYRTTDDPKA